MRRTLHWRGSKAVAEGVVEEERRRQKIEKSRQCVGTMGAHVEAQGMRPGVRVRNIYSGEEFVVVGITKTHQLELRVPEARVPKRSTSSPLVFEVVEPTSG